MRLIGIGLLLASAASSAALAETSPGWRISESSGGVFVLSRGVSKAALGGSDVAAGDLVSTAANGRAVLVRGQEYLIVAPNSRFRVVEPTPTDSLTQIFEEIGTVVFKINKQAAPHFAVQTPYLAAVVKGTTFSVTVTNAGSSVQVTEGAVQVATLDGKSTDLIRPGMIGMVGRDRQQQLMVDNGQRVAPAAGSVPAPVLDTAPSPATVAEPGGASVIAARVDEIPSPALPQTIAASPAGGVIRQAAIAGPSAFSQASIGQAVGDPLVANAITEAVRSQPIAVASASGSSGINAGSTNGGAAGASGAGSLGSGNSGASANGGNSGGGSNNSGSGSANSGGNNSGGSGNAGNGNGGAGNASAGNGNSNSGSGNGDAGNANSGNGNGNSGSGNGGGGNANSGNGNGNSGNGNGAAGNDNSGNGNGNSGSGNAGNGNSGSGNSGNGNGNSGSANSGNGGSGVSVGPIQITLGNGITIQVNNTATGTTVARVGLLGGLLGHH